MKHIIALTGILGILLLTIPLTGQQRFGSLRSDSIALISVEFRSVHHEPGSKSVRNPEDIRHIVGMLKSLTLGAWDAGRQIPRPEDSLLRLRFDAWRDEVLFLDKAVFVGKSVWTIDSSEVVSVVDWFDCLRSNRSQ